MVKLFSANFFLTACLALTISLTFFDDAAGQKNSPDAQAAVEKTQTLLKEITAESFPEISAEKLKVKSFHSQTNFFKTRFSFTRYLTFQSMRTIVYVNPSIFEMGAPDDGIRAVLAHELAHALYYKRKNRLELLGLAALLDSDFIAKFERRADLTAIERGYGEGLIKYREWLYRQIPAEKAKKKQRNYFTPEEIELLIPVIRKKPGLIKKLKKNVPRDLDELNKKLNSK